MTEQRAVLPQTSPLFGPRFQARGARRSARYSLQYAAELTKHPWVQDTGNDVDSLVARSCQDNRLLPQPGRRDFTDNGIGRRSNGTVVDEVEHDQEGSHSHGSLGCSMEAECRDDVKGLTLSASIPRDVDSTHHTHADHSSSEDGSSTQERHEHP